MVRWAETANQAAEKLEGCLPDRYQRHQSPSHHHHLWIDGDGLGQLVQCQVPYCPPYKPTENLTSNLNVIWVIVLDAFHVAEVCILRSVLGRLDSAAPDAPCRSEVCRASQPGTSPIGTLSFSPFGLLLRMTNSRPGPCSFNLRWSIFAASFRP